MKIAYKYRLYPNQEQKVFLHKNMGCSRFVYNQMLANRKSLYEEYKQVKEKYDNYRDYLIKNDLYELKPSHLKKEFEWLKEVDSLALCNAELNLNTAYRNFFRDVSVGYPKFKKKISHQKYKTNNQKSSIDIEVNNKIAYIKLPKLKNNKIKLKYHRPIPKNRIIKSATIERKPCGTYYISILVEQVSKDKLPTSKNKIGIDVGLKDFAITSNKDKISNPKFLRKSEKKIKKLQRSVSRKKLKSNNRNKARLKLAKAYEKVNHQKQDFLHKLTSKMINENQVIVIEDLAIKNMVKNHKLAKAIHEVSWYRFREMLAYKCEWYGRKLIVAPKKYASSQLCSNCETKNPKVKNLSVREWTCDYCHMTHDRDINASKNLLKLANSCQ